MIVLDTNVISEVMRERPDAGVLAWIDRHAADELCVAGDEERERLRRLRHRCHRSLARERLIKHHAAPSR